MKKQVVYYINSKNENPVWEYFQALPPDEQAKCYEYIGYLERRGEDIRRPVGDYLGNKLYELRPKRSRIIYFFFLREYAVLVHAFRKQTDEIPKKDMNLAHSRMLDFISRLQKGETWLEREK